MDFRKTSQVYFPSEPLRQNGLPECSHFMPSSRMRGTKISRASRGGEPAIGTRELNTSFAPERSGQFPGHELAVYDRALQVAWHMGL
jgi:hypothetical protein